jgi:hypothetical protein
VVYRNLLLWNGSAKVFFMLVSVMLIEYIKSVCVK